MKKKIKHSTTEFNLTEIFNSLNHKSEEDENEREIKFDLEENDIREIPINKKNFVLFQTKKFAENLRKSSRDSWKINSHSATRKPKEKKSRLFSSETKIEEKIKPKKWNLVDLINYFTITKKFISKLRKLGYIRFKLLF